MDSTAHVTAAGSRSLGVAALVVALAALAYSPLPRNGSVGIDDDDVVFENPAVVAGLGVGAVEYAFTNRQHYFQPLSFVSLAADRSVFGLDPRGFHAVNWLIHVATALAVLFGLAAGTGRVAAATAVAVAFVAHPVNVEAVAWAAERRTVLAGLLGVASCLAYARWSRRRGAGRYALALLAFALSLLAKPMLLALPAMLLALDVWPLRRIAGPDRREGWVRLLLEKAPFALLSVASAAATIVSLERAGMGDVASRGLGLRAANAVVVPFRYLAHLVFPSDLTFFYPYPERPPALWPVALAAAIAVTLAGIRLCARAPWWLAGWCWFVAALLPTLGLRQGGTWAALADRHAYVAVLGPLAAACFQVDAWVAARGERVRRAALACAVATGLALAALAARQVTFWRDGLTLMQRAIAYAPGVSMLHYSFGLELAKRGYDPDAEHHLRAAVEGCGVRPLACWMPWRTYTTLSVLYSRTARFEEAIGAAQAARAANPRYAEAAYNLARLLHVSGRFSEALPHYQAFVRLAPPGMEAARDEVVGILRSPQPAAR